jgi:hypothetical protein
MLQDLLYWVVTAVLVVSGLAVMIGACVWVLARLGKSQLKRERQNMYALHQYDTRPIPPPGLGFGRFVDIDAKVADNLLLLTGSSWAVVIGLVLFWGSLYILRYHLG